MTKMECFQQAIENNEDYAEGYAMAAACRGVVRIEGDCLVEQSKRTSLPAIASAGLTISGEPTRLIGVSAQ